MIKHHNNYHFNRPAIAPLLVASATLHNGRWSGPRDRNDRDESAKPS